MTQVKEFRAVFLNCPLPNQLKGFMKIPLKRLLLGIACTGMLTIYGCGGGGGGSDSSTASSPYINFSGNANGESVIDANNQKVKFLTLSRSMEVDSKVPTDITLDSSNRLVKGSSQIIGSVESVAGSNNSTIEAMLAPDGTALGVSTSANGASLVNTKTTFGSPGGTGTGTGTGTGAGTTSTACPTGYIKTMFGSTCTSSSDGSLCTPDVNCPGGTGGTAGGTGTGGGTQCGIASEIKLVTVTNGSPNIPSVCQANRQDNWAAAYDGAMDVQGVCGLAMKPTNSITGKQITNIKNMSACFCVKNYTFSAGSVGTKCFTFYDLIQ